MKHVGVDLGSRQSAICILNAQGVIEHERTIPTDELDRLFAKLDRSVVVMESCAESRKVALMALAKHEVRVVPTTVVRALGVGARRIKTDKRDAKNLAEASFRMREQLPTVHVRSDEAATLQDAVNVRASLISARTMAINFTRGWLRKELLRSPRCAPEVFPRRIREQLNLPSDALHPVIGGHLIVIETLNEQIAMHDKRITLLAKSEKAARLQKICGVGPIVALAFLAAIDDPKRFDSASRVASYVGLSPGESTTGGKIRRTGVVAAGQQQLRTLLVQAAHSKMNARLLDPMALWAKELERKKGRKVATCALARRLAIVMWAMLRDGTSYDADKTRPRAQVTDASADPTTGEVFAALLNS